MNYFILYASTFLLIKHDKFNDSFSLSIIDNR